MQFPARAHVTSRVRQLDERPLVAREIVHRIVQGFDGNPVNIKPIIVDLYICDFEYPALAILELDQQLTFAKRNHIAGVAAPAADNILEGHIGRRHRV